MHYARFIVLVILLTGSAKSFSQDLKVEIKKESNGTWQFYRNKSPYYIRGAGGSTHLDKLVAMGGNSIRTWGIDNAQEILDNAQKHGLTVMLGVSFALISDLVYRETLEWWANRKLSAVKSETTSDIVVDEKVSDL
jgi:hypothetical protein